MGRMSMSAMQGRTTSAPTSALSARLKVDKNNNLADGQEQLTKIPSTNKKTPAIDQKMSKILKSTMNTSGVSKGEAKGNTVSSVNKMQQILGNAMKKKVNSELSSQMSSKLTVGENRIGSAQPGRASVGTKT